jgi:hypothetical protein
MKTCGDKVRNGYARAATQERTGTGAAGGLAGARMFRWRAHFRSTAASTAGCTPP